MLGGYVRIIGMSNTEEVDPQDEPRTYRQGTYGKRLVVVLAGVAVNFLLAFLLFFAVLVGNGIADGPSTTIATIVADSAAAEAGFRTGDRIVAVDRTPIDGWNDLKAAIEARGGESATFTVQRGERRVDIEATPRASGGQGFLGIGPATRIREVGVLEAVPESIATMGGIIGRTGEAVGDMFSPSGVSEYSKNFTSDAPKAGTPAAQNRFVSVIGIVDQGSRLIDGNVWKLLALLGALNVAVALINLVPLPPFDGGHAAIVVYELVASKVTRRRVRVDYRKLAPVTIVVLAIFLTLSLSAMFLDIRDAVGN
jgi:membrane-associated protease RseP (regulator of RpoE activity)